MNECPRCKTFSLPLSKGGDAVACQNGECRRIVTLEGEVIGYFDEGYENATYTRKQAQV